MCRAIFLQNQSVVSLSPQRQGVDSWSWTCGGLCWSSTGGVDAHPTQVLAGRQVNVWSRGRPSDGFSWIWIYSGYMSTWGSTLLLNSWALPWSRGTIIHWYRCIDIQNRSLVITIYHHNYHVSLPSIDHGQPSKFDHGDGQGLSVRRTCNSWRWTWKKVARSPGMWPWAHLGRAGG